MLRYALTMEQAEIGNTKVTPTAKPPEEAYRWYADEGNNAAGLLHNQCVAE
jgi:hypothetical protein